jgi:hypothetical protein
MSYTTQRRLRCDIIVLNVHAPTKDKHDDTKDSFYKELECIFNQFSKYHVNILLRDKGKGKVVPVLFFFFKLSTTP